jgi:ankyrin repeat protein
MKHLAVGILLLVPVVAFADPNDARTQLSKMNIAFTAEEFEYAIWQGNRTVVELFLTGGMSANTRESGSQWPVLTRAASRGNVEVVKSLLAHGADVNGRGPWGVTALMYANPENTETSRLLLDAGAPIDARDDDRATALMYAAAMGGSTEKVRLLLTRGADVNATGSLLKHSDSTALHYAADGGRSEVIKELLRYHADANAKNADGMTPLMWAANRGDVSSITALLDAGANPAAKSDDGKTTVWDRAIFSQGRGIDVVRLLIDRRADINLPNGDGRTPLNFAILKRDIAIVRTLLANGANPNARDNDGVSLLRMTQLCLGNDEEPCRVIGDLLKGSGARE